VDVVTGLSYLKLLKGDAAGADALLAGVEATAGERLGEVKLRRALAAVDAGDLEAVKAHGTASNLPTGQLLAAEVELADGNRDAARALLEQAAAAPGAVGETAKSYLSLMSDADPLVSGLSEAQALWALGQRRIAVRSVIDLVRAYAAVREDGSEQLLLWAGRAASVGEADIANSLLDEISVSPAGQKWRVDATRAIAACAGGDGPGCIAQFDALTAFAPADGLADAKITAAVAVSEKDADTARRLLEGLRGDAAARALAQLGDTAGAASAAADPLFKRQLGG
jgi:uncharacterized protein HemY